MAIKRLGFENFGIIKKADFIFDKKINIFSADNGHGKSTAFEGIDLMLFNECRDTLESNKNWNSNYYKTYMEFDFGDNYYFDYEFKKNLTRKLIINNNVSNPIENSEVLTYLRSKFDLDFLRASVMFSQGDMDICKVTPAERRDLFKRIFNLEFKESLKEIDNDIKKLKEIDLINIEKEIYFYQNKEYKEQEIKELPFSFAEYESKIKLKEETALKISELKAKQEKLIKLINDKETLKKSILSIKEKYNLLIENKTTTNNNLITKEIYLNSNDFNVHLKELEESLNKDFEVSLRTLEEKRKQDFDINLNLYKQELSNITLDRTPNYNSLELDSLVKDKTVIEVKIKNILESIKLCESGKCPTCGTSFKDSDIAAKKEELRLAEEEKNIINTKILDLTSIKNKYDEIIKNNAIRQNRIDVLKASIDSEEKLISNKKTSLEKEISTEIERIKTEKETIIKAINSEKKMIDINKSSISTEISMLKEKLVDIDNSVKNIEIDLSDKELNLVKIENEIKDYETINFNDLQALLNVLNSAIDDFSKIQISNETAKKYNEDLEVQRKIDLKEKELLIKKQGEVNEEIADLEKCKIIIKKEFPNYVIDKTIKSVENNMNIFFEQTYGSRYLVNIKSNAVGVDILYKENNDKNSLQSIKRTSGFERALMKLSFQVALCLLSNIKLLIVDEADAFASAKNSENLFRLLADYTYKHLDQLFIVTHNPSTITMLENEYNADTFEFNYGKVTKK